MSTRGRSSVSTRDMKVMNEFEMEFVVNKFEMVKAKINEFEMVKTKIIKYEDGRNENRIGFEMEFVVNEFEMVKIKIVKYENGIDEMV